MTCGRSGVGSITTIDVRIDGTDGWLINWIEIETDFETSRFESNVYVDDYETVRFFRSPMNARKSYSSMNKLVLRCLKESRKLTYESVLSSQLTYESVLSSQLTYESVMSSQLTVSILTICSWCLRHQRADWALRVRGHRQPRLPYDERR